MLLMGTEAGGAEGSRVPPCGGPAAVALDSSSVRTAGLGVAFAGFGMLGTRPSEVVYEDIGAVPMGEKVEGSSVPLDLVPEEDYDDAWEPEPGPEEPEEEQEEEPEEGTALSSVGVHLCALASAVLVLLYCSYVHGSALASAYI